MGARSNDPAVATGAMLLVISAEQLEQIVTRAVRAALGPGDDELVPVESRADRKAARGGAFPAYVVARRLMARRADLAAWHRRNPVVDPSTPKTEPDDYADACRPRGAR